MATKRECKSIELIKARKTISKLKQSVNDWKDAWYQLRGIIGNNWISHPAIANDEARAYYQNLQSEIAKKKQCQT